MVEGILLRNNCFSLCRCVFINNKYVLNIIKHCSIGFGGIMRIINAQVFLEQALSQEEVLRHIEKAGRVCYKSESKISDHSAEKFVENIIRSGHESVIEHFSITFRIICDRGVTHELVRHRIASYSQESTRYCNYSNDSFGNELTFIKPCFWDENDKNYLIWKEAMQNAEKYYLELMKNGAKPQEARDVLPNSVKTEIYVTMNIRSWRNFLKLRTSKRAHPQMREIAFMIYNCLYDNLPILFNDIEIEE